MRISIALRNMYFAGQRDVLETGALNEMLINAPPTVEKVNRRGLIRIPDDQLYILAPLTPWRQSYTTAWSAVWGGGRRYRTTSSTVHLRSVSPSAIAGVRSNRSPDTR